MPFGCAGSGDGGVAPTPCPRNTKNLRLWYATRLNVPSRSPSVTRPAAPTAKRRAAVYWRYWAPDLPGGLRGAAGGAVLVLRLSGAA